MKDSVWPTLTLIDVAKPWIVESPAPFTCQSLGDRQAAVLAGDRVAAGPHGSIAPARRTAGTPSASSGAISAMAQTMTTTRVIPIRDDIRLMFWSASPSSMDAVGIHDRPASSKKRS